MQPGARTLQGPTSVPSQETRVTPQSGAGPHTHRLIIVVPVVCEQDFRGNRHEKSRGGA